MTVVFIQWEDAHLKWGTFDGDEVAAFHPIIMSTTGILLRKTDEEIVVCHDTHMSDGDAYYRVIEAIPMKYVVSIQEWEPNVS